MKSFTKNFKNVLQNLFYDQELVNNLKKADVSKEKLYNHLTSGRITLEEYVNAIK